MALATAATPNPTLISSEQKTVTVMLPECQWALTVRGQEEEFSRIFALTWQDKYYYDNAHAVAWLGFRFRDALDPTLTAQTLKAAIQEYPVVGSKVIMYDGKQKFLFDAEKITVRLLHVEGRMLQSMDELQKLCDIALVPNPDRKKRPLFKAFLFKSCDERDGSALICAFEHCVGDAMSYALFMKHWSECYERSSLKAQSPDLEMPPEVFAQYSLLSKSNHRTDDSPLYRHFAFSTSDLQALKEEVLQVCFKEEMLTTNDILCAQCAIALAPFRFEALGTDGDMEEGVRIFMLADSRGRSKDGRAVTAFGNYVADIPVDFVWRELLDSSPTNVVSIARKIRLTLTAYTFDDGRRSCKELRKLLCWNSWARVGPIMRGAQFQAKAPDRSNLQEMRWFNARWSPDAATVVVEPAACANAAAGDVLIVIHVASPHATAEAEGQSLRRFWGSATVWED